MARMCIEVAKLLGGKPRHCSMIDRERQEDTLWPESTRFLEWAREESFLAAAPHLKHSNGSGDW